MPLTTCKERPAGAGEPGSGQGAKEQPLVKTPVKKKLLLLVIEALLWDRQAIDQAIQSSYVLQQRQRDAADPQRHSRLQVSWKGWADLKARWKHAFETSRDKWVVKWKVKLDK